MDEYTFSVLRELTSAEISQLRADCRPKLNFLVDRYVSDTVLDADFPSTVHHLDFLRGSWLLDKAEDRPDYQSVVLGVGFEFGNLLARDYGFTWSLIKDPYGESVSLVRSGGEYDRVSVPPFSYVEKREQTQNVEVFKDFIKQVAPEILTGTSE